MAKSNITVKVEGLDKLLRSLDKQRDEVKFLVSAELRDSASAMEEGAALAAPVDHGFLKAGITSKEENDLSFVVNSAAEYSAYVEFGTLSSVKIPPGLEDVAAQFKGAGIRHGKGMRPRSFFFPQLDKERPKLIKKLKKVLGAK